MNHISDRLECLISCPHELQAVAVVSMLAGQGIKAQAVGGYTSGFKAEAPGTVDVLVMGDDLEKAAAVLRSSQTDDAEVDWSETPVGDSEVHDSQESGDQCLSDTKTIDRREIIIYAGLALIILWQLAGLLFSR